MKAITVRNLPPRLAKAVRERARRERTSLNGAVIRLIEERLEAGHAKPAAAQHHDLDFLFGTWTKEEADEFDGALALQRAIDGELWK
jgi:hypothetical protein